MAEKTVEEIWNATRGEGNPEYKLVTPEGRARLQHVYAEAKAGRPETGIAGLEEFERQVRASVKAEGQAGDVTAPTLRDSVAQQQAEPTPQGSGAQEPEEKALKDAAAAGERVEADEVHSPDAPSAARPLAAEAPGSAANPTAEDAGAGEGEAAGSSGESEESSGESEDLSELNVTDLKERAKAAGVKGYSSMNKGELVAAVEKAEGGLQALNVNELKDRAREAGVKGFSSMNKEELIAAVEEAEQKGEGEE